MYFRFGARAIGDDEAVAGGAVMVCRGEAANVQPAEAARRDDGGLRLHRQELLGIEAVEDRARAFAVLIENQLHRRLELADGNHVRMVAHLVHEGAHDDRADIVAAGNHALA